MKQFAVLSVAFWCQSVMAFGAVPRASGRCEAFSPGDAPSCGAFLATGQSVFIFDGQTQADHDAVLNDIWEAIDVASPFFSASCINAWKEMYCTQNFLPCDASGLPQYTCKSSCLMLWAEDLCKPGFDTLAQHGYGDNLIMCTETFGSVAQNQTYLHPYYLQEHEGDPIFPEGQYSINGTSMDCMESTLRPTANPTPMPTANPSASPTLKFEAVPRASGRCEAFSPGDAPNCGTHLAAGKSVFVFDGQTQADQDAALFWVWMAYGYVADGYVIEDIEDTIDSEVLNRCIEAWKEFYCTQNFLACDASGRPQYTCKSGCLKLWAAEDSCKTLVDQLIQVGAADESWFQCTQTFGNAAERDLFLHPYYLQEHEGDPIFPERQYSINGTSMDCSGFSSDELNDASFPQATIIGTLALLCFFVGPLLA